MSVEQYAVQIRNAATAQDMHKIADAVGKDRELPRRDVSLLQLKFDLRCRDLFPQVFKRRGGRS